MPTLTGPAVRSRLQALMVATLADEQKRGDWTYEAVRPMPVPATWEAGQHVIGDCSKGVQFLCKWAGAPDPMRNGFSRYGNSETITVMLEPVLHPSELEIGDIVTFGPRGDDHAAMVLEPGVDPLLWSFGHQGAPNTYRLSYDRRERHYRRLPLPKRKPTRAEILQAKTGYWAWVQWRLGEGDWHGYKPRTAAVRPNVATRIPLAWWRDYARFIANRRKANEATT